MDEYFESYDDLSVHQLMLEDEQRTLAYKNAIFNSNAFKDKIVMDVGAGTGILSIFCAQAGAKLVYAVEASHLAAITEQVVAENKLEDVIKVIQSRVEDLDSNEFQKVDIIVSEWMGFYLVHEGMLDSVLLARDRFLTEDGILFPSIAKLFASPCQLPSMFQFWDDVYGVDMRCVGEKYREQKSKKPEILCVNKSDLLTKSKMIAWLDLQCVSTSELQKLGEEHFVTVCEKDGRFQGVCIWFAVEFPDTSELSTGPFDKPTHWKQTAIVLPNEIEVVKDEPIAFKLNLERNAEKPRQYNMELILLDPEEVYHDIPCACYMTKCIVTRTYIEQTESDLVNDG